MTEIRAFRFLALLLGATVLCGGAYAAYHWFEARPTRAMINSAKENRTQASEMGCLRLPRPKKPTMEQLNCPGTVEDIDQALPILEAAARPHEEQAETAAVATLLACAGMVILFYGIRWALTGRLLPLWPTVASSTNVEPSLGS